MKLVISMPTRGRPQQLLDTITKSTAQLALDSTVLMVQVDDDDKETIAALENGALPRRAFRALKVNIGPREDTIADKWNRALKEPADVYLVSADDAPEATPEFDAKILQTAKLLPDRIGVVYGHLANLSFPSIMAPTAKFAEKLGHIFPPLFPYWFVDHWVDDITRLIGRIAFADIRTDQSKVGVTQEMREPAWWATFFDAAYLMRRSIAHKIMDSKDFQGPTWMKDLLKAHAPNIEMRSRMINESVRQQSREFEWRNRHLSLSDPRYQRVKKRALELVPHLLDDYGMAKDEANAYRKMLIEEDKVVALPKAYA
jgi:hypothetical protein